MELTYSPLTPDMVPPRYQVPALDASELGEKRVETLEEGLAIYMERFRKQFSTSGAERREWDIKRFFRYLKSQGHSMKLSALTYADGKGFLDNLVNANDGSELSQAKKEDYKSALRSFSRFLADSGIIQEDVFFALKAE